MPLSSPIFMLFVLGYLLFSSLIGGGILRIAVQLHNRFAINMRYGGVIEEPSFGMATGMMLAINFILLMLTALVQVYLQSSGIVLTWSVRLGVSGCMICLNVVVMTWLVALAFQAPWIRALVISCIQVVIALVIAMTFIGTLAFVAFDS